MLTLWATINIKSTQELRTPPSKHITPLTPFSVHHSHTTWGPPPIDTISTSTYDITQHSMHLDIPTDPEAWNVPSPTSTTEGDPNVPSPTPTTEGDPTTKQQYKEYNHTLVGGNTNKNTVGKGGLPSYLYDMLLLRRVRWSMPEHQTDLFFLLRGFMSQ